MLRRRLVLASAVTAGLLVVVLVIGVATAVVSVRRGFPDYDGTVPVAGLTSEVEVLRDEHGIPQIYADTAEDLFRAQGYVHAQDRFWQMDFRRHLTAGRLSELFGEQTLDTDRFLRTMDWQGVAERELPRLDPDTRRYLQAYADGVNAWLADREGAQLGVAYPLIGLSGGNNDPEPWRPVHSVAWLKAMAWDLRGNMSDEIERALLAADLDRDVVESLYPDPAAGPDAILSPDEFRASDSPGLVDADGALLPFQDVEALGLPRVEQDADVRAALSRTATGASGLPTMLGTGDGLGSNSWVVSGEHTASGAPLLANDPHLGPTMPSVWYQGGLRCRERTPDCPFDVAGFSFAGLPGVVIGHNADIAWGFTNLNPDVTDLVVEQISGPEGAQTVRTPDGEVPVTTREEVIEVAGADPVTITVRSTPNGPVVSDQDAEIGRAGSNAVAAGSPADDADDVADDDADAADADGAETAVALRWTALQPGRTADAIFALDAATDWDSFRVAASLFEVPAQNLVYADVEGNIGYQAPGKIPVRRDSDGRWPVPGWTGEGDWVGYVPFQELPSVLNPEDGVVVTANQEVGPEGYPYLLTSDWSHPQRAQRIGELLEQSGPLDVMTMGEIQNDTLHPLAGELLPVLADLPVESGYYGDGLRLLADWDGHQRADSAAAAYFTVFWSRLVQNTFADELGGWTGRESNGRWYTLVGQMLEDREHPLWDDVRTDAVENRTTVVVASVREARDEMTRLQGKDPAGWSWGRLHALEITDETFGTSGIGLVEDLFTTGPFDVGGGPATVNAVSYSSDEGFAPSAVPSMRMVVDLADLDASRWIDLTGISGHPTHEHFGDQTQRWLQGTTLPMRWSRPVVERALEHTLVLEPAEPEGSTGG